MKPIVLIINDADNGKITLTQDEFKKHIADAYEHGYADGQKNSWICGQNLNTITNPTVTWKGPSNQDLNYNPYDTTCTQTAKIMDNTYKGE